MPNSIIAQEQELADEVLTQEEESACECGEVWCEECALRAEEDNEEEL